MNAAVATRLCRAAVSGTFSRRLSSYPKHELVGMPSLSPTMTSGTVGSWGKKVGDKCSPGESVAEIETDKASMAFEAQDEFYVAKLLVEAGVEVPVGSPMMITVEDESFVAAFADYVVPSSAPAAVAAPAPTPVVAAPVAAAPVVVAAPVVAAPKPTPAPVGVVAPTPAPVIAAPAPVATYAAPSSVTGVYSAKWSIGAVAKSAIAPKMAKGQLAYIEKYGRSMQKPLSV